MNQKSAIQIGVLVPAGNVVHEREFARLQPEGVHFRFLGFSYPAASSDFCLDLANDMQAPIEELKAWGAELVLVGCTTASMLCADEAWRARLEKVAGVPVVTAASASRQAIAALGATAVAVTTPYGELNNRIVSNFLESQGVEVAALQGQNLDRSLDVWLARAPTMTTQEILEFSLSVDVARAQAMYLPCTGIGSLEALDLFEKKAGKPALSSVQAGYWASLRRLGFDGRKKGYGRLLEVWDF